MRPHRFRTGAQVFVGALAVLTVVLLVPRVARSGALIYESEDFTVEVGLRMQPRFQIFKLPDDPLGVRRTGGIAQLQRYREHSIHLLMHAISPDGVKVIIFEQLIDVRRVNDASTA